jgi:GTP-binding protein
LQKALQSRLKPIVIINKVDRPSARPVEVEHEIFNLFCDLDAPTDSLEYPLFFCSGKEGWVRKGSMDAEKQGLENVLETIVDAIPSP